MNKDLCTFHEDLFVLSGDNAEHLMRLVVRKHSVQFVAVPAQENADNVRLGAGRRRERLNTELNRQVNATYGPVTLHYSAV